LRTDVAALQLKQLQRLPENEGAGGSGITSPTGLSVRSNTKLWLWWYHLDALALLWSSSIRWSHSASNRQPGREDAPFTPRTALAVGFYFTNSQRIQDFFPQECLEEQKLPNKRREESRRMSLQAKCLRFGRSGGWEPR